jgi:simple sugar transport system ATP-binding protein
MRRRLGIETVPEERNGHAAVTAMSLTDNTFLTRYSDYAFGLSWLKRVLVNPASAQAETREIITKNDVRVPNNDPLGGQLSGGNLQKFIMGRMLIATPRVAIINQPTWGVDVGAATAIHRNLLALAQQGCAIILISQDLEEILTLSHRIGVLNEGRLSPLQNATNMTAESIGLLMGGAETAA